MASAIQARKADTSSAGVVRPRTKLITMIKAPDGAAHLNQRGFVSPQPGIEDLWDDYRCLTAPADDVSAFPA